MCVYRIRRNVYCITFITYILDVKIQLFVTLKSDQDPDPHGSELVWLPGSGSALREKAGSGSALKPMRIHNTALCPPIFGPEKKAGSNLK